MVSGILLAALLAMTGSDGDRPGAAPQPAATEQPAAAEPPGPAVQHGPEVSGSRSDTSPPLRDIKAAPEKPGKRVHPWRHIPRPRPPPKPGKGK